MPDPRRDPSRIFAAPSVTVEHLADGSRILRHPEPLGDYPRALGLYLEHWAEQAPDRPFLQERGGDGQWTGVTYREALDRVVRIGTALIRFGLTAERPAAILSDNSVENGLIQLAAMHVGVPVALVSPSYSVVSRDHVKLRRIIEITTPGLIYVGDHARYEPALTAIAPGHDAVVVSGTLGGSEPHPAPFSTLLDRRDDAAVAARFDQVGPDTVAKLLFTSGSTGEPKGVANTQRMLSSNQQAKAQVWPFLAEEPPVIVDWLPWSHTFGANHNFNLVLRNGGTLYIDGGRPMPGLFDQTLENLRSVAPTLYFNVPRGFDMLVTALRADEALRRHFFSRIRLVFYAGAALPQHLWDALTELAMAAVGSPVPMVSAWGSTETAPLATDCHFQADRAGVIGNPIPGTDLRLVPNGSKLEVRVRGPNVTPGYWRRPDLTAAAFDELGFYRIGDAVRLVDESRPELGLLFDGRVAEDFKLDTGTWVNAGMIRVRGIAALAPVAQDIVVTGHDRSEIGFLILPNLAGCRGLCPDLAAEASPSAVLDHPAVRERVAAGLAAMRTDSPQSSGHAARAILAAEPPSIDRGEITDKGYVNQRAVLVNRAALVTALYQGSDPRVILANR